MIKEKKITIDSKQFQLHPLPLMKALKLDKKVMELVLPVFGEALKNDVVIENILNQEIDLKNILSMMSESLSKLNDNEFEQFINDMFSTIVYIPKGQAPVQMTEINLNQVFDDGLITVYKLLLEVMKFNKFTPFVVAGGGLGIIKTSLLEKVI